MNNTTTPPTPPPQKASLSVQLSDDNSKYPSLGIVSFKQVSCLPCGSRQGKERIFSFYYHYNLDSSSVLLWLTKLSVAFSCISQPDCMLPVPQTTLISYLISRPKNVFKNEGLFLHFANFSSVSLSFNRNTFLSFHPSKKGFFE